MLSFPNTLSPPPAAPAASRTAAVDRWHEAAAADYRMARLFADQFDSRLSPTDHSRRVGWERDGRGVYGILLPDPLPSASLTDYDWYIYYVWGETLFRRTRREREKLRMLVLPDSAEDWAHLLRRAVRREVFDVGWKVTPQYTNALGEVETTPSGFEFSLAACAPPTASPGSFQVGGIGGTPEEAARNACLRWLRSVNADVTA